MPSDRTIPELEHVLGIDPYGWLLLRDPIWVFDLKSNRVVWANDAALEFWRADCPEELYARDMGAQSDVTRARLAEYSAQFDRGETVDATWTLYPRGVEQIVRCRCSGVPMAAGRTAMLVHALEIGGHPRTGIISAESASDNLREARDQLAMTEARFRAFADVGSDWLWETDAEQRFTYASLGAHEDHGYPADQSLGMTRHELFDRIGVNGDSGESREKWQAHARDLAAYRPFRDFEYSYRTVQGDIRHALISGDPVFDATGAFMGYRGIGRDITWRVEAESLARKMQRERDVALTANSVTNQLLATMSHELRTPLNAIIGFSEVMLRELMGPMGNPVYHDYAQVVFDSATHLLGIVEDLLDVSRTDFGQHALDIEDIDADEFLREVLRMTSHLARERNLVLDHSVAEPGLMIGADRRGLRQVLLNLISNAIKFSPAGSLIEVTCRRADAGHVELSVRDMGSGIDPEDIPHVFEPFRSADPLVARETGGVGLGLWITKRIVEAHGGSIAIDSKRGAGTTVTVRLPDSPVGQNPESRMHGEGI